MQQLSGQDAMFLHAELDGLPQHIGGVSIYDQSTAPGGKVRFKADSGHAGKPRPPVTHIPPQAGVRALWPGSSLLGGGPGFRHGIPCAAHCPAQAR